MCAMAAIVLCESGLRLTVECCRQDMENLRNAVAVRNEDVEQDDVVRAIKRET